ncbi:adhesion G-protein coupled receptor G4 isoform X2 [Gouania willdenowi]|uniref:adhesion G-protein coupled receptor G4 isoform X2 n=1 Tax=Gouania willdenowi TaxID=441366 RepID=UPI00105431BE|nr:adhesion G-protein coupled receptor G4-like isoform X2 [Gouania willdenowi]
MTSFRIKTSWTIYLLMFSLCLITSASSSLWGQKLQFKGMPCLWQLRPEAVVPALEELSACILLRRDVATKWTGFVYKAPGERKMELGVGGSGEQLSVWLFGKERHFPMKMVSNEWQSICITWSGGAQRLKVYVNGTTLEETYLDHTSPKKLAQNGTLSLGVSHFSVDGEVERERGTDLVGEIGLFRMWSREWSDEDLLRLKCADGDVVSWTKDLHQGQHPCPPQPDSNIQCEWSFYKIQMKTLLHSTSLANCSATLEGTTRDWMETIFPPNIYLQNISVLHPSHTCHMVNDSVIDPLHVPQPQALDEVSNSSCDECFSCEVSVNVNPAVSVEVVQAKIAALLSVTYSSGFINLTADPKTLSIFPVALLENDPPSFVRSTVATSESGPTLSSLTTSLSNISTTGEPLDFNETIFLRDTFLRVNLTLYVTSSNQNPKAFIQKWIKDQLEANRSMTVINLNIKDIGGRNGEQHTRLTTFQSQQKQYFCTFHVQEFKMNAVTEVIDIVQRLLNVTYVNSSITIQTVKLEIKHIVPQNCLEDPMSTIYGDYIWPETFPQVNQEMGCLKPKAKRAYRLCKLDINTDMTSWDDPDMTSCTPLITIPDLNNITVTPDNVVEVVDKIEDLVHEQLGNSEELSPTDLQLVVEKLGEVVDLSPIKHAVGADIVNIIDNILLSNTDVTSFSENVLKLTDKMGNNMDVQSETLGLTASSLALSMVSAEQEDFGGLTFGVSSDPSTMNPKIFVNQSFVSDPLPETVATISLPSGLNKFFQPGVRNKTRIQFHFYGNTELFQDQSIETQSNTRINSFIVSASINNSHVFNLSPEERVVVTLSHQQLKQPEDTVRCMFWDFQKNGGRGGWNSNGCVTKSISPLQSSCFCDHLTHFGLLLDVSRTSVGETDRKILTVISYLGCGISSLFLGITLLTYLIFEKLRRDYPSKILINLSAALLGLSMLFLLDSWLASFSNYDLCIATAATLHYFLLASFTWMGLEAVHMYLALVKVFNTYIPSYILKFCAVGWGVPLLIVSLVLAIDKDAYGSVVPDHAAAVLESTDPFCWLQSDVVFYVTVVAFVLIVLIGNISVFIVVLIQIRRTRANKPPENSRSALHDLRAVASLTVLLGLTWSMGLFSFGPARVVLLYLFAFSSTFQGKY